MLQSLYDLTYVKHWEQYLAHGMVHVLAFLSTTVQASQKQGF